MEVVVAYIAREQMIVHNQLSDDWDNSKLGPLVTYDWNGVQTEGNAGGRARKRKSIKWKLRGADRLIEKGH